MINTETRKPCNIDYEITYITGTIMSKLHSSLN